MGGGRQTVSKEQKAVDGKHILVDDKVRTATKDSNHGTQSYKRKTEYREQITEMAHSLIQRTADRQQ